ncbi:uncharacterized protein LOC130120472 [Lampris incognitus]|uniref:uncharacterized protein LOC130120472 n=1 Tax=Lampris incognitus TaxID=2546036 RepID=UPI0024B54121|nr:uncharacterized protein LOC130120472 [Lampris incognitus]
MIMTHFRGQIRGPHWGPAMDNMLIEFWRKHECLFNSSIESYHDKDLKTKLWSEFAMSIGKPASDVERRSRSLRTQYGRLLWHPERVNTFQQRMLREKLDFLRPYIVRRRVDASLEGKFDDEEDDDEEVETEGSIDQDTVSMFGSPLDADVSCPDPTYGPQLVTPTIYTSTNYCPPMQPKVAEVTSLSSNSQNDESPSDPRLSGRVSVVPKHDILNQFAEVMLADMQLIKDPFLLMRLRRDITDLVFKAVEEDIERRQGWSSSIPASRENVQLHNSTRPHESTPLKMNLSRRQRYFERRSKGSLIGRRRWEELQHLRRVSRSQGMQPVQQGQELERIGETNPQVAVQTFEIKGEPEPGMVKIEEETLPVV